MRKPQTLRWLQVKMLEFLHGLVDYVGVLSHGLHTTAMALPLKEKNFLSPVNPTS